MTSNRKVSLEHLGQSGFRIKAQKSTIYIDPYLSDSVEKHDGPHMKRMAPSPIRPEEVRDADAVLITHDHMDHADLETLIPISISSPRAIFISPSSVRNKLLSAGIKDHRLITTEERWIDLYSDIYFHPLPACHPEILRDAEGNPECVGFIIKTGKHIIYHAGDTSPANEILDKLKALGRIDLGLIPVNERNFFKERQNIIGNMTLREAYLFADEANMKNIWPIHWDMFRNNSVSLEEIILVHRITGTRSNLVFDDDCLANNGAPRGE